MPFKKGEVTNPKGRPTGSKNKSTTVLKNWIADFVEANRERIESDFELLEPKERIQMFEKLLSYVIPRQQTFNIEQEYKQLELLLMKAPEKAIEAISMKLIELNNKNTTENESE